MKLVRPLQQRFDALLQQALRLGVDGGGGLVQNQDARVGQQRPGKGDQLPLALTETAAALVDRRVRTAGASGAMNSWARTALAAAMTSSSVASSRP